MKINSKNWVCVYLVMQLILVCAVIFMVVVLDPYFHYHKPLESFYYILDTNNERSINDGIEKYFEYTGMITGTSMTQCFNTSEADVIYERDFIKVPFAGATYKEIDQNIQKAIKYQEKLDIVIRGLDMQLILWDKDRMREDMGIYPTWLYDDYLNDIQYIFNKDVIKICVYMFALKIKGVSGGMTSFDDYANWTDYYTFGAHALLDNHQAFTEPMATIPLSIEERCMVEESIRQNVISTALSNPDIDFLIFFPPYSAVAYGDLYTQGELERYIDAERCAIEVMLECKNIKLFSFDLDQDITMNLDNYRDPHHYGEWINSKILSNMKRGVGLITEDNWEDYLSRKLELYSSFDYNSLFSFE